MMEGIEMQSPAADDGLSRSSTPSYFHDQPRSTSVSPLFFQDSDIEDDCDDDRVRLDDEDTLYHGSNRDGHSHSDVTATVESFDFPEEEEATNSLITAHHVAQGVDMQGIPWGQLQTAREQYRLARCRQYKNYTNLNIDRSTYSHEISTPHKTGRYYDFYSNNGAIHPSFVHFQLRNLVWATSAHDVYYLENFAIHHYNDIARQSEVVLSVAGTGLMLEGRVQVSSTFVDRHRALLFAGGFSGEIICTNLRSKTQHYRGKVSYSDNSITNSIDTFDARGGAAVVHMSNNDCFIRQFDIETFQMLNYKQYPWAVNHSTVSPDGRLTCVVGDDAGGLVCETETGKVVATLEGHKDFSFASAWHPDGRIVATGNQDMTCRLWDTRYLASSFAVLPANIGAVRSIRFTEDGQQMIFSEPADYVHVYDVASNFTVCQEIALFGEVAGVSVSPDSSRIFIGVADKYYGSMLQFSKHYPNDHFTSMLF